MINAELLFQELLAANLPVLSVSPDGNIRMASLSEEQEKLYNNILQDHLKIKDPKKDVKSLAGLKLEEMNKSQRALYDNVIGQILGILDDQGKVK